MSMINYHDPTVIQMNLDDNGKEVSLPMVNETKQVVDGKIPLEGLPNEQYRVQITNYVEVDIRDEIDAPNKFKCDYTHGVLYFDQSKNGQNINIDKYYSRGQFYIPSSRVWTRINSFGEVVETLDDLTNTINNLEDRIDVGNTLKGQLDNRITQGDTIKGQLDSNISTGNSLKTDLDNRISTSNTKKQELDSSINTANTTKSNLDGSISSGNTIKEQLDSNISKGNTLKTDLDGKVSTATTRRNELDNRIPIATTRRDELDARIILSEIAIGNTINAQQTLEDMVADIDGSDPFTQKFIATANQDTFTLALGKYKNIDMILVYIQGVLLEPLADFTIIGDGNFNKIKINEKLPSGTEVVIKVLQTVPIWAGTTILP